MTDHTKDLSVRIESDDGSVLLDQIITVDCSDGSTQTYHYGEGAYGENGYDS